MVPALVEIPSLMADLPRVVFSSLSRLPPDTSDAHLTDLLEHIVKAVEGQAGFLLDLPPGSLQPQVLCRWGRFGFDSEAFDWHRCPWLLSRELRGDPLLLRHVPDDLPEQAAGDAEHLACHGVRSLLIVPVIDEDKFLALAVLFADPEAWHVQAPLVLRFTAEILATAMSQRQVRRDLERARVELSKLSQRLESQTRAFKDEILTVHDFEDIVGDSPAFRAALGAIQEVAPTDTTVLLLGETGTGKELFARALHDRSPRRERPFVCINCSALPASLIEAELFGHERGAFTGAVGARQGRFELADRGTIFLDEIGDLPLELQPKLLRVLQEREFERVGGSVSRRVDVRVVAATHRDLESAVAQGRFRVDLYFRLSVFPVLLPPLRERREDIPRLVWFLVNQRQRRLHRRITDIPSATMEALQCYHWPGNIRELENLIERAMIRSPNGTLRVDESLTADSLPPIVLNDFGTLKALERAHIEATLRACGGRVNGRGNAAERLGLHPNTLRFRMKKLGVVRRPV